MDKLPVGERIKQLRKQNNLSVDELAAVIGKNKATVYRYENSQIENMPVTVLKPIADALHTTPDYLMGWIDEEEEEEEKTKVKNEVNVGSRLKQLRESHNKTLLEVATEIFISVDDLKKYESGLTNVPIEVLEKVAIYFNVDIKDLTTVKFPTSDRTALVTKDIELAKRQEKWFRELGFSNFTDEELDELISYAKYIKSKRNVKE